MHIHAVDPVVSRYYTIYHNTVLHVYNKAITGVEHNS